MGTKPPPPKRGHSSPQFSAHVCCGQTAGWIKMPLGMEVGLGPGHKLPGLKGAQSPLFGYVYCGQSARRMMGQYATWYESRPRPRPHCVRKKLPPKGAQPPIFGSCLLWPNGRPSQLLLSACCKPSPNLLISSLSSVYCGFQALIHYST